MTDPPKPFYHCSGCGYDLRGSLTVSACPECGAEVLLEVDQIRRERALVLARALTAPVLTFATSAVAVLVPLIWAVRPSSPSLPLLALGLLIVLFFSLPALIQQLKAAHQEWGGWRGVRLALGVSAVSTVTMASSLLLVLGVVAMFSSVMPLAGALTGATAALIVCLASIAVLQKLLTVPVRQRLDSLQGEGS